MDAITGPGSAAQMAKNVAEAVSEVVADTVTRAYSRSVSAVSAETFYENFLELLAQLTSLALTDDETEKIAAQLRKFHATLRRVSSRQGMVGATPASGASGGSSPSSASAQWLGGGAGVSATPTPVDADAASDDAAAAPAGGWTLASFTGPRARPPEPLRCKHAGTCLQNATRGWLRSFVVGYLMKYTVGTLPGILLGKGSFLRNPRKVLTRELNRDTVHFALFLSSFISAYKALFCATRGALARVHAVRHGSAPNRATCPSAIKYRKVAAFLAGGIASTTALLDKNHLRRTAVCLYFLTRAFEFAAKYVFALWRRHRERVRRKLLEQQREALREVRRQKWAEEQLLRASRGETDGMLGDSSAHFELLNDDDEDDVDGEGRPPGKNTAAGDGDKAAGLAAREKEAEALPKSIVDYLTDGLEASTGTLLMSATASQILFSFVAMPDSLASSYMGFLLTHSGFRDRMGPLTVHYLRLMGRVLWRVTGHPDLADKFLPLAPHMAEPDTRVLPPLHTAARPLWRDGNDGSPPSTHQYAMCAMIHPETRNCGVSAATSFKRSLVRSAKLYLPLNIAITLVFGARRLRKQHPGKTILRILTSTARSSVFLAGYVSTAFALTCLVRRALGREMVATYWINGMAAGAWSLVESRGRRLELALYCLPRALEAAWSCLQMAEFLPQSPPSGAAARNMPLLHRVLVDRRVGEPMYFAAAMAVLMMLWETENWVISPGYRTVMARFFGVN